MKRFLALFLTAVLFFTLLPGCGRDEIPTEPTELWVVTEPSQKYGMNEQAEVMAKRFQETYPHVTVRLDVLPIGTEERAVYLDSLRTQIMAGSGPDVFLMPVSMEVYDRDDSSWTADIPISVEPLFRDVTQCMYNGIFADISKYYDADDTLGKEAFTPGVMEAGVIDGCRYTLPLRYSHNLIVVNESMNVDTSGLDGSLTSTLEYLLRQDDKNIHYGLQTYPSWSDFSNLVDYEQNEVSLTTQELAEVLKLYQEAMVHVGPLSYEDFPGYATSLYAYTEWDEFFALYGYPFARTSMDNTLLQLATTAKLAGTPICVIPERTTDGAVLAEINYFGAVSAGCPYPKLAYEYLRLFLSEEAQWEMYTGRNGNPKASGFVAWGYPVRSIGSVEPLFKNLRSVSKATSIRGYVTNRNKREQALLSEDFTMTDADVPGLATPVDIARYPIIQEDEDSMYYDLDQLLNDDYTASDVDIDLLAQQIIDNLKKYIAEG